MLHHSFSKKNLRIFLVILQQLICFDLVIHNDDSSWTKILDSSKLVAIKMNIKENDF